MVGLAGKEALRLLAIEMKGDLVVGDGVFVLADGFEVGAIFGGTKRKFPESLTPGVVAGRKQNLVLVEPEEGVFVDGDKFLTRLFGGEAFGRAGLAEIADRADETAGGARGANGLSELHQGRIEEAGVFWVEERGGAFPDDLASCGGIDREV